MKKELNQRQHLRQVVKTLKALGYTFPHPEQLEEGKWLELFGHFEGYSYMIMIDKIER